MATLKVDSLDREKRPEPFSIELTDGTEVTFADPKRLQWTTVVRLDDMAPMERMETLTGAGFDKLRTDPEIDGERMNLIMAAWRAHYGIGGQGEA